VVLLGHSLGGMVALSLAAQADRAGRVSRVVAFAVKSWWPPEHVEGMRRQADREVRTWPRREEALGAYAKVSGLHGLVPADSPALAPGVVGTDGAWQLAQDPATFDFGTPDVPGTVAAATAAGVPVTLARGSEDPFVRAVDLAALVPDPVTLEGLGHNPHVEDPAAVVALLG
jgi:pimeloyl-ACP methyl ester carboxylesterase